MSPQNCSPFRENLPALALGVLEGEELADLQAHLESCPDCQAELAAFMEVSGNLLFSTPPHTPPAALRKRLQAQLPSGKKVTKPRPSWSWTQIALGAGVAMLLLLNLVTLWQVRSLQQQQSVLARQAGASQTALAMLAYPGTQSIPITGQNISGSFLVDNDRSVAALVLWNLPPLKNNQTYQIWLTDAKDNRTSAGIFQPDTNQPFTTAAVFSAVNLSNFVSIGVTVEPGTGSPQPTGQRIFKISY